ncbi:hypothetical protein ACOSQ4_021868 [Xanthoceras sorbifolium]
MNNLKCIRNNEYHNHKRWKSLLKKKHYCFLMNSLNMGIGKSKNSKGWKNCSQKFQEHMESNEGDPELLVYIPTHEEFILIDCDRFTSDVKIKSILVVGGTDGTSPSKMRVYFNFQSVASITLHFPENFGGDTTQIHYIGLKGEVTQLKRDVVATIVYEITPNPSDHKTKAEHGGCLSHVE